MNRPISDAVPPSDPARGVDDASAKQFIQSFAESAERFESRSPGGGMVWRAWGTGPVLVLLHGGSGSWTHWIHTIPHFSGRFRVIAGDLPGCGDSPSPQEPYSAESLAGIVADGIDQLVPAEGSFDLVGFSFGGILGGHVAGQQSHRIRSLTVVGSPPFGIGTSGAANDILPVDPVLPFDEALALHRYNLELFMFGDARKVDALALRIHHENLRRGRLRSRKIARTDTLARALRETTCRLGGIWGGDDVTVHPSMDAIHELFAEVRPDSVVDVLPGAGHWVAYEDAVRFNLLLEGKLEKLASP